MSVRLPLRPVPTTAHPAVVDRATWQAACDDLLVREKAHTREGDALAAARRRLPMTPVPAQARVQGPDGPVPFVDVFEGRTQLIAYFHMWHDGQPPEGQCEGCTFFTAGIQRPAYLHSRDVTLVVLCQGTFEESRPYADLVGDELPWYSARDAEPLLAGRGFGFFAGYLRLGGDVFETWWGTGRGTEAMSPSYQLLDRTAYGRQETWEDSPAGWPQLFDARSGAQFRVAGRPTIQWTVTDVEAAAGSDEHHAACH
ncbi:DUF899 family protein [Kineococcus sp. SYSU DK001]|uniref:DUF899 family protein n=1 Tax=Kineococcus sp. SYSU DK001 TaxID=3383122 RepID=UPI003D7EFA32